MIEQGDYDGDGFDPCTGDCNESSVSAYPGAYDAWGDGLDHNCDLVDGMDVDGDGWPGNADEDDPTWDCDDGDTTLNRDDADGDGVDTCNEDCDDADAALFPGNWSEFDGDGIDHNCDGFDWFSLGAASLVLLGSQEFDKAGHAVASSGDFDGDGIEDLAISSVGSGANSGSVSFVSLGSSLTGVVDLYSV